MNKIHGIAVSSGIAIAKAYRLESVTPTIEKKEITDSKSEISRLEDAIAQSSSDLESIKNQAKIDFGEDEASIFAAHLLVLNDPELADAVKEKITAGTNAEFALKEAADSFIALFEAMDNEYMRERAADIRDVTQRIQSHLAGVAMSDPSAINEEVIIIAEDLTPSATAQLNRNFVQGFVTDIGGRTSHSAILARILEIPAIVGTKTATTDIEHGTLVIIDGQEGIAIVDPSADVIAVYQEKKKQHDAEKEVLKKYLNEPSISADGHQVELGANIGTPEDLEMAIANGCEGVGLFRTEFLYMGRESFPTEDEQYESYKSVIERMGEKPTVVRTLDIGGDKELSYLQLPEEMNPFLGLRAIRLCLEMPDMFRTQLRALLRASIHGNLKIMFPMIATLEEFREAKRMLVEESDKLKAKGVAVSDQIEVGMMLEIPSAAIIADLFAKEVDFFSIGTNDLIQYTMAADRMNESVSYLYQPYNAAILRLVKNVIDEAHKEGKWVGMCGEVAGDQIAIPILLAMGLDEFSMSAPSILPARSLIHSLSKKDWEKQLDHILALPTSDEVKSFVENFKN